VINGIEVKQAILENGDKIVVGDFTLRYSTTTTSSRNSDSSSDDSSLNSDNFSKKTKTRKGKDVHRKKIPLGNKENAHNNIANTTNKVKIVQDRLGNGTTTKATVRARIRCGHAQQESSPSASSVLPPPPLPQPQPSEQNHALSETKQEEVSQTERKLPIVGVHESLFDADDLSIASCAKACQQGIPTIEGEVNTSIVDDKNVIESNNTPVPTTKRNVPDQYVNTSKLSLQAMRSDTRNLLSSGRPSFDTMMAQWEFMRDQFLGSSDEALEWMMLSKTGGRAAYTHAKRKTQLAEDQYFKALFDIDLLENKKKLLNQDLAFVLQKLSNRVNCEANLKQLRKSFQTNLRGICSKQLSTPLAEFLQHPEMPGLLENTVHAFKEEMKILGERLHSSVVVSEESLGEMEKWSEREKNTTAYREDMISEDLVWMETHAEQNASALAQMRQIIPSNVCQLSVSELTNLLKDRGGFYSHALCSEIKKNKLLHLVIMHPEDISKLNFLMGDSRRYFLDLDLDVVEMRAIRACLPETFELDKDGRKAEWKEKFVVKLKQLVARESGDLVRGGWDAEAGKRVMVRLPALHAHERRRSVYFHETHEQLLKQLERYDKQESLLATKKQLLQDTEHQHVELKTEYDTILAESRNPANQQQYGLEALSLAKEAAKRDYNASELKKKRILADISRIESSINTAAHTKHDVLQYIRSHKEFLGGWDCSEERFPIHGVFEPHPVIHKMAKASAVFATAEEEAATRQSELMLLKSRTTTTTSTANNMSADEESGTISSACSSAKSFKKVQVNSSTIQTLNSMFQKEGGLQKKASFSSEESPAGNGAPPAMLPKPIQSKNLQVREVYFNAVAV
jgi:hypothetical protein